MGLTRARSSEEGPRRRSRHPGVVKTPGVCGGSARIDGTRIPIWQLVEERQLGASEAQLLNDYRTLKARDLVAAWDYAEEHPEEIDQDIRRNAMGVTRGSLLCRRGLPLPGGRGPSAARP